MTFPVLAHFKDWPVSRLFTFQDSHGTACLLTFPPFGAIFGRVTGFDSDLSQKWILNLQPIKGLWGREKRQKEEGDISEKTCAWTWQKKYFVKMPSHRFCVSQFLWQ